MKDVFVIIIKANLWFPIFTMSYDSNLPASSSPPSPPTSDSSISNPNYSSGYNPLIQNTVPKTETSVFGNKVFLFMLFFIVVIILGIIMMKNAKTKLGGIPYLDIDF
jgi:hypothetical protein